MPRFPKLDKSLLGQILGISDRGNLVSAAGGAQKNITSPCCHVTGTISAEGATVANQRDITLQLRDANGDVCGEAVFAAPLAEAHGQRNELFTATLKASREIAAVEMSLTRRAVG